VGELIADGYAMISSTVLRGQTALRMCPINPRTTQADIRETLRRLEKAINPKHGYPEMFMMETVAGVADFLDGVGTAPLNQITGYGTAPMPPLVMFNLPTCEAMINGKGPYRLVVDTGGIEVLPERIRKGARPLTEHTPLAIASAEFIPQIREQAEMAIEAADASCSSLTHRAA
jgi:hypothetical protein